MKLSEKLIEKYKRDFHYSDLKGRDQETNTWQYENESYCKVKDCYRLRNCYGSWIEIKSKDIKIAFCKAENNPNITPIEIKKPIRRI